MFRRFLQVQQMVDVLTNTLHKPSLKNTSFYGCSQFLWLFFVEKPPILCTNNLKLHKPWRLSLNHAYFRPRHPRHRRQVTVAKPWHCRVPCEPSRQNADYINQKSKSSQTHRRNPRDVSVQPFPAIETMLKLCHIYQATIEAVNSYHPAD